MTATAVELLADRRCPLCSGDNGCAMASGTGEASPCWCTSAHIGAALLARVPADRLGRVCVCAACARADGTAALPRS